MTTVLGIDFSLTSPAYTVISDRVVQCTCFSGIKNTLVQSIVSPLDHKVEFHITIYPIQKQFKSIYERMDYLAKVTCLLAKDCELVAMEDYSFGSTGRVFSIAEITGFVKYKLWQLQKPPQLFAPASIKKWATGKGNASKELMIDAFTKTTGISLLDLFPLNNRKLGSSPYSDIADSFHIANLCRHISLTTNSMDS